MSLIGLVANVLPSQAFALARAGAEHWEDPLKFTRLFLLLSVLTLGFVATPAWADTIAITNPSFETVDPLHPLNQLCGAGCAFNTSIPGWTITGGPSQFPAGQFQPGSGFFTQPVPDGSLVAYSNGGTISQTLAASLTPNTTYTLSVDVGRRLDAGLNSYTIELLAGTNILAFLTNPNSLITPGTFSLESFSYNSGITGPFGQPLGIAFLTPGPQQINYDNVQLTASAASEPGSLALLATGLGLALFLFRRR